MPPEAGRTSDRPRPIGEEACQAPPRGTRFWQNHRGRFALGYHHALPAQRQRPQGADAMIRPATWKQINALLGQEAVKSGAIDASTIRADTTAIETNIHWPTDTSLLWDTWRVASRLLRRGRALAQKPACTASTTARSSGCTFIKKSFLVLLLTIHVGHFLGLTQHLNRYAHEFLQLVELSAVC